MAFKDWIENNQKKLSTHHKKKILKWKNLKKKARLKSGKNFEE